MVQTITGHSRQQIDALQSVATAYNDRRIEWHKAEPTERRAVWLGRLLLFGPLSGGIIAVLYFSGPSAPAIGAFLAGISVYFQAVVFATLFYKTEQRWYVYRRTRDHLDNATREIEDLITSLKSDQGNPQ